MDKKTIIIRTDELKARACAIIQALPMEPVSEVVIRLHHKDRTAAQNSLMWLWLTIIGAELGMTKDEMHDHYKERLLIPIYSRDDTGFLEMVKAVERADMMRQVVRLVSTTTATIPQFTEYLVDIERDALGKGIVLPHPEDRYRIAMGIKP